MPSNCTVIWFWNITLLGNNYRTTWKPNLAYKIFLALRVNNYIFILKNKCVTQLSLQNMIKWTIKIQNVISNYCHYENKLGKLIL